MDQDRWKTVNEIFHAALELSSDERLPFVKSASGGDTDLQVEVAMLLNADRNAGSYLESPLITGELFPLPASPVGPGDVLCGRFRILRAVGEGGMGHVFAAVDTELAVQVAVKIIRPEIASNPEALARFRQEVRLARRITHPNVCRTFDIEREIIPVDSDHGSKREVVFLTMEYLEGESLDSRIRQTGPLVPEVAMEIARQIAGALGAAHALGIVHRDMKPANIMLVPVEGRATDRFRAVISDFGLARLDPIHSSGSLPGLSQATRPIGTLAYMAPEQLEGKAVSAATDIYAFGLVLFEMVTGARAFPSENFLSSVTQRLSGPPPSPQSLMPNLGAPWCRAIEGCLRLDPAERFRLASDVIAVLDGSRIALPRAGRTRLLQRWTLSSRPLWRRLMVLAVTLPAIVALSSLALRLYRLNADSKVATGALIYLTPVKNETGEKPLDNLTELIQADLTQSAQIDLLDQGREGDILQQMTKAPDTVVDPPVAREIAMRAGAVRVVFATMTGSNGDYRLNIDVEQPDNSPAFYREHWPRSFSWHNASAPISNDTIPPDLLRTVRAASDWIRTIVGESKNDIARLDIPPGDATTGSWEALGDYTQAKKLMMQGRRPDAVTALDRALRIDPAFALAYAMRGDILFSLHRETEGRKSYADALDAGIHDRLTRREEDRIRGMRAVDSEDYEIAVDVFHDLTLNYPTDMEGWVYPSSALRMLNRNDEAIANLRRAVTLAPDSSFAPYALGQELLIEGRYEEVPKWIDFLRKHNHPENADELESADLFLSHDYQGARRALQAIRTSTSPIRRSYSYRDIADLDAENGNLQSAIDELVQGLLEDKERGDQEQYAAKLLGKAYLECRLMRFESCLQDEHAGFGLSPTLEHALAADTVLGLAFEESPASNLGGLQHELQEILRQEPNDFGRRSEEVRLRTRGTLQLAEGRPQDALRTMTIAATKDSPAGNREYLGRALLAVAKISRDKAKTRELLRSAQAAYAAVALHPALILCDPGISPPGDYGDQLEHYLQISRQLDDNTESVQQARRDFLALRSNHLTNSVQ